MNLVHPASFSGNLSFITQNDIRVNWRKFGVTPLYHWVSSFEFTSQPGFTKMPPYPGSIRPGKISFESHDLEVFRCLTACQLILSPPVFASNSHSLSLMISDVVLVAQGAAILVVVIGASLVVCIWIKFRPIERLTSYDDLEGGDVRQTEAISEATPLLSRPSLHLDLSFNSMPTVLQRFGLPTPAGSTVSGSASSSPPASLFSKRLRADSSSNASAPSGHTGIYTPPSTPPESSSISLAKQLQSLSHARPLLSEYAHPLLNWRN